MLVAAMVVTNQNTPDYLSTTINKVTKLHLHSGGLKHGGAIGTLGDSEIDLMQGHTAHNEFFWYCQNMPPSPIVRIKVKYNSDRLCYFVFVQCA